MAKIENDQRPRAKTGAGRFDPSAFLATTAKGRAISAHRKGDKFFAQGDAADAIFYIKKGKLKVTVVSKQGKEAVVALLSSDEFFGEGCLIGQPRRLATATAMTECVTMRVEILEMRRVLRREPEFSQMFVSHILTRSARVEGSRRPAVQLNGETACPSAPVVSQFWQRGAARAGGGKDYSGNTRRDDWHNPIPREPFQEQIPEGRFHQLQWPSRSAQHPAKRCVNRPGDALSEFARLTCAGRPRPREAPSNQ
jgi:hypothetical protein